MAYVPNVLEVISGSMPLFDTYILAVATATPTDIRMFTEPQSNTKGINLTNMTSPGKLESPKAFLVQALRVVTGPDIAFADLSSLIKNYILRLIVDDAEYALAGIESFPSGAGIVGAVATNDATATKYAHYNNGQQDPRAIAVFDKPIEINQGSSFRVELKGTSFTTAASAAGGAGLWVRVYLDGILHRGK